MLITRGRSRKEAEYIVLMWYQEWPETFKIITVEESVNTLLDLIYKDVMLLFIAYEGSNIISSCCVCLQTNEILNLITDHRYRHRGYGTHLLKQVIRESPNYDIDELSIKCSYSVSEWLEKHLGFKYDDSTRECYEFTMTVECQPLSPIIKKLKENA